MSLKAKVRLENIVLKSNVGRASALPFIGMKGSSMNSVKRQQLASERIRKLEDELEQVRGKLNAAQIKNGQEDKRISELISTLDALKANYLEKIQEVENIRDEYEQISNDLKVFRNTMISNFSRKDSK